MLRVDLVLAYPKYSCTVLYRGNLKKKWIVSIMRRKQRKSFWKCYITCLFVKTSTEDIALTAFWLRRLIYTLFSTYCVLYHIVRDGTNVQRAIQFVCHMCILRLANVLRAQRKCASLSNCQKWRFVHVTIKLPYKSHPHTQQPPRTRINFCYKGKKSKHSAFYMKEWYKDYVTVNTFVSSQAGSECLAHRASLFYLFLFT